MAKFETGNTYTLLDCDEDVGGVGDGEHVLVATVEPTTTDEDGEHAGSVVGNWVEAEETGRERPAAWHGILLRGVEIIHTVVGAVVDGVGGVIGCIATGPFGRVRTAGKTCPVR